MSDAVSIHADEQQNLMGNAMKLQVAAYLIIRRQCDVTGEQPAVCSAKSDAGVTANLVQHIICLFGRFHGDPEGECACVIAGYGISEHDGTEVASAEQCGHLISPISCWDGICKS